MSLALTGAVAVVCACVHAAASPTTIAVGEAEGRELPREFVVLSWNTHKQRGRRFPTESLRLLAGVDLVLLQEATEAEPVWGDPDRRAWTMVVAFEYTRTEVATGVATGSIAAPLRERAMLSVDHEPLTRTPKSALLSWLDLAGEAELLVVNLHGINFRRAEALAAQLRALDDPLDAHAGPVLVAGDFNTWSGPRREVLDGFATRHELVSAFGDEEPRLDHVYIRGLEVESAAVIRSRSSDHDALRVELRLPAR